MAITSRTSSTLSLAAAAATTLNSSSSSKSSSSKTLKSSSTKSAKTTTLSMFDLIKNFRTKILNQLFGNDINKLCRDHKGHNHCNGLNNRNKTLKSQKSQVKSSYFHDYIKYDICIIVAIICCYSNALKCDFVFDDLLAIKENMDLRPQTPIWQIFFNDFWGLSMDNEKSHKSYRPLCVLTFRLNYWLHQLQPFGYHLFNIILHQIVSLQYFRFVQLFRMSKCSSFLAAIFFAIHPIHTEAVTSVVGRAECLCAIFYLWTIFTYYYSMISSNTISKWLWLIASLLSMTVATFSKEQGITSVAICLVVIELFFNQKLHRLLALSLNHHYNNSSNNGIKNSDRITWKSLKTNAKIIQRSSMISNGPKWIIEMIIRIIVCSLWTIALMAIRLRLMQWQLPIFTKFDNPAINTHNLLSRHLTLNFIYAYNFWLLLNPWNLCCDWTMGSIPLIVSFNDYRNIFTFIFYSFILSILSYKSYQRYYSWVHNSINRNNNGHYHSSNKNNVNTISNDYRIIVSSFILIVIPFIPASNLFFPVGFVIAERVLYIPSMGYCILVAFCIDKCRRRLIYKCSYHRNLMNILISIFILMQSLRTIIRNNDWKNEFNLYSSGIRVNGNNAKLYNNLGYVYESNRQYSNALNQYLKAVQIQSNDIGAYMNVARVYNQIKRLDLAEQYYQRAKTILMSELHEQKRLIKVDNNSNNNNGNKHVRVAPNHLNLFINLGQIISKNQSRSHEAIDLYRQLISIRPDYVDAYVNLGDIQLRMNRTDDAHRTYQTALKYSRNNADIYFNLGVVSIQSNRLNDAIDYFHKTIELNSNHSQALFNYAMAVQNARRSDLATKAINCLRTLIEYDPKNERLYFNMAMLSMLSKQYLDAEQLFRQTIELNPRYSSAYFNLALLLSENPQKANESIIYLNQLLKLQPNHLKGLILLCDLLINHLQDYDQSLHCYNRLLKLDPQNIEAKHNQCIVWIEKNQLNQAETCLYEAKRIASTNHNQNYLDKHLKIVRLRIVNEQYRRYHHHYSKISSTK